MAFLSQVYKSTKACNPVQTLHNIEPTRRGASF